MSTKCSDCEEKDVQIVELHRQMGELQANISALRGALENAHTDPDMQIAVLDALRSIVVDRLRQKYLQVGVMHQTGGE